MLPSTISSIRAIEGDEVLDYGGSVEAHRGAGASSARAQRWNERATSGHDRLTARRLTARAGLSQADSPRLSRSPKAATWRLSVGGSGMAPAWGAGSWGGGWGGGWSSGWGR